MPIVRAADCHAHVFCDASYAFAADPVYIPEPSQRGTAAGFLAVLDAHGLSHGLLVVSILSSLQPSKHSRWSIASGFPIGPSCESMSAWITVPDSPA